MPINESSKGLRNIYEYTSGPSASYMNNSRLQQEVAEVLIAATLNGMEPVSTAVDHGIPEIMASTGLSALIHVESVLEPVTLKLLTKDVEKSIK